MKALALAVCATVASFACSTEPAAVRVEGHNLSAGTGGGPSPALPSAPVPADSTPAPTTTTVPEPVPSTVIIPVDPELNPPETVATTVRRTTTTTERPTQLQPVVHGDCGGSLPPCWVMRRESGGDIRAVNYSGCGGRGCYGKWQFDPRTSAALGYLLTMDQYAESVQDDAARSLWAGGRDCSAWAAC